MEQFSPSDSHGGYRWHLFRLAATTWRNEISDSQIIPDQMADCVAKDHVIPSKHQNPKNESIGCHRLELKTNNYIS